MPLGGFSTQSDTLVGDSHRAPSTDWLSADHGPGFAFREPNYRHFPSLAVSYGTVPMGVVSTHSDTLFGDGQRAPSTDRISAGRGPVVHDFTFGEIRDLR